MPLMKMCIRDRNYIGVAWEAQIMKNPIPMERYDQRMPAIVTEQGVIHVI